jgi:hypothetical protein
VYEQTCEVRSTLVPLVTRSYNDILLILVTIARLVTFEMVKWIIVYLRDHGYGMVIHHHRAFPHVVELMAGDSPQGITQPVTSAARNACEAPVIMHSLHEGHEINAYRASGDYPKIVLFNFLRSA